MKQSQLYAGPLLAAIVGFFLLQSGSTPAIAWTASVTTLCCIWWVFEPIPIPVTSLIPLSLFPLVGVLTPNEVGESYGNPMILLLLGGLMLSTAMERSGAHRRLALTMVSLLGGTSARTLVLGFMVASAFLSMWISNTATTLMLLPIVLALLEQSQDDRLKTSLLLGVAYAASVGGICTPVGSPPNLVFMQEFAELTGVEITFLQWMSWTLPIALVMIPLIGLWLTRGLQIKESIALPEIGVWRAEEVRTLLVFGLTAMFWITRLEPYGGWSNLLGLHNANDASVALAAVVAMFLVPNGRGERLLDWQTASNIPWGILILFGSGIAIAKAFTSSGLSDLLGNALSGVGALPVLLTIGLVCLAVTFLTEVTSNTATVNLLMPILAPTAISAQIDPRLIMVPATISASFAFMLPVATPPNAIVFGSRHVSIRDMVREGFVLNLVGCAVVTGFCYLFFTLVDY